LRKERGLEETLRISCAISSTIASHRKDEKHKEEKGKKGTGRSASGIPGPLSSKDGERKVMTPRSPYSAPGSVLQGGEKTIKGEAKGRERGRLLHLHTQSILGGGEMGSNNFSTTSRRWSKKGKEGD